MEFIEATMFTALIAEYMEHDEYRAFQSFLAGQPEAGDVMPGTVAFASSDGLIGVEARASVVASG